VIVFVLAMTAGMILKDLWDRRVPSAIVVGEVSLSTSTDG
jgi:4-hydroxybenzoate polyprenyltransferase